MFSSAIALAVSHALMGVLAIGMSGSAHATLVQTSSDESRVQLIVRYGADAPKQRREAPPWGVQCVDRKYRERLVAKRALGVGMWVVVVEPPVAPRVAERIARQIDRCPGVAWAEVPRVEYTVPLRHTPAPHGEM